MCNCRSRKKWDTDINGQGVDRRNMTTPVSPVLGRGELTSSGTARPDNVPLLPLEQPKSHVDRPRVQSPIGQAQTSNPQLAKRPVTAEGQFRHVAVPAARLDSYTMPQTRFWCPSCRFCHCEHEMRVNQCQACVAPAHPLAQGKVQTGLHGPKTLRMPHARQSEYSPRNHAGALMSLVTTAVTSLTISAARAQSLPSQARSGFWPVAGPCIRSACSFSRRVSAFTVST